MPTHHKRRVRLSVGHFQDRFAMFEVHVGLSRHNSCHRDAFSQQLRQCETSFNLDPSGFMQAMRATKTRQQRADVKAAYMSYEFHAAASHPA